MIPAVDSMAKPSQWPAPPPPPFGDGTFAAVVGGGAQAGAEAGGEDPVVDEVPEGPPAGTIWPMPTLSGPGSAVPAAASADASPCAPLGNGDAAAAAAASALPSLADAAAQPNGPTDITGDMPGDLSLPESAVAEGRQADGAPKVVRSEPAMQVHRLNSRIDSAASGAARLLFEARHQVSAPDTEAVVPTADRPETPLADRTAPERPVPVGGSVTADQTPAFSHATSALSTCPEGVGVPAGPRDADRPAQPIAAQVRQAIQEGLSLTAQASPSEAPGPPQGGSRIELRLDPEELGAVSIILQDHDDSLLVRISTERPDTLDLMRRNADQLLTELRVAGFAGAEMRFDTGGDQPPPQYSANETEIPDSTQDVAPPPNAPWLHPAPSIPPEAGLFIRL